VVKNLFFILYFMLNSLATLQSCAKYNKSGPAGAGTVAITSNGTLNTHYLKTTASGYTFFAFATTQTITLASTVGSPTLYWCVVGAGGGGGNGDSTATNQKMGGAGGAMGYATSTAANDTITITIGAGGQKGISTSNGVCNAQQPTDGGNSSISGSSYSITANGGRFGTYNNPTVVASTKTQGASSTGSVSNFASYNGADTTNSAGANGGAGANASNGATGNTPPSPISLGYNIPLGSSGGGSCYLSHTGGNAAPFAGPGCSAQSQANCGVVHPTYNTAVLAGVSGASNATSCVWTNSNSMVSGDAASNSGCGAGGSQSKGNSAQGGSGIVILAILTSELA
jgi:hypothetical protein